MNEETTAVPTGTTTRRLMKMGTFGLVACGICCAVPLLGIIGGATAVSAVGWLTKGVVSAALLGLAAMIAGVWYWRHRRQCRVPACSVPQNRTR